jgi:hypothetical protein
VPIPSIVWFGQVLNRFAGANVESVIARGFPHPPSDCSRTGCGQESGSVAFGAHPAGQVGMADWFPGGLRLEGCMEGSIIESLRAIAC